MAKRDARRAHLRPVPDRAGVRRPITGEEVYRRGAKLLSDFLSQQLDELVGDPLYDAIEADASRLAALAGSRSPRTLPG